MKQFAIRGCLSGVIVLSFVTGCSLQNRPSPSTSFSERTNKPSGDQEGTVPADDHPTDTAPRPHEKPPGILLAYPATKGTNTDQQNFASGIGWYLSDAVAGAPELGQSPLRSTVTQAAVERKMSSLRLSKSDALRLARVCGATVFAVGTYAEGPNEARLSYELFQVGKPETSLFSKVFVATDRVALLSQLPQVAQQIRTVLQVPHSAVTVAPLNDVTPAVMALIGNCADSSSASADQEKQLRELGKNVPLAAELALYLPSVRWDIQEANTYVRLLRKSVPINTQVLGSIAYTTPKSLLSEVTGVYALCDRFPQNYALAHSATWLTRTGSDWNREYLYSKRATQNAPANPDAHLTRAGTLSDRANRLRMNRQSDDIPANALSQILPMYSEWLEEARTATQCDPLSGKAHQRLACAATFAGDRQEAEQAMTVARKLNSSSPFDTYDWALEMYQPKWGGDPTKLREVAQEAAEARYRSNDEALQIYRKLGQLQFTDIQQKMGDRLLQQSEQDLARNPKDMYAHYLHGTLLTERGARRREALADFVANAENYPENSGVHFDLGKLYIDRSQFPEAEASLRKSLALLPQNSEALHYLAYALKHQNKLPEAQKAAEKALAINPDYVDALVLLGTVNLMQNRIAPGMRAYEHVMKIQPYRPEVNINLATYYNSVGRENETIRLGESFLRYYPDNPQMIQLIDQAKKQLKRKN